MNFRNDLNPNDIVYRVFPFSRLIQVFVCEKLTLVNPELWDDPWENYLYQVPLFTAHELPISGKELIQNHSIDLSEKRNAVYAQCWTRVEESDAMWRIYSPNHDGVRVKTTAHKLYQSISEGQDPCIGNVQYERVQEIHSQTDYFQAVEEGFSIDQLLIKRIAFEHEEEVRLIDVDETINSKIKHYSIDPNEFFDELTFDSRLSEDLYEVNEKLFRDKLGFNGVINQSQLYAPPF